MSTKGLCDECSKVFREAGEKLNEMLDRWRPAPPSRESDTDILDAVTNGGT